MTNSRGLCRMPNDIEHMEFASFNFYKVSSTVFTMGIKPAINPGNKDPSGTGTTKRTVVTA